MIRTVFKSKLHMAAITETELEYDGSITIPKDLMDQADFLAGERVQVVNMNNGDRLETYVIEGPTGNCNICLNGPAARRGMVGDRIVVISYAQMSDDEIKGFKPTVVVLDDGNRVTEIK